MLDPHAVVQRELRAHAPVVLHVAAEVVRVDVERRRQRHVVAERAAALELAAWIAEKERGDRVAVGRAAVVRAGRRREFAAEADAAGGAARIQQIHADPAEVGAQLERVRADEPRVRGIAPGRLVRAV